MLTGARSESRGGGGLLLHPSVEVSTAIDDNIYREHQNTDSDTIYYVRPGISGISRWSRHELQFNALVESVNYAKADDEDVTNWSADVNGRYDISRRVWLNADLSVRELHEERGGPERYGRTLKPVSYNVTDFGIQGVWRPNRFSLEVEGRYIGREYEDAVDVSGRQASKQSDRNRDERQISIRTGYDLSPGTEVFLRTTDFRRRYDQFEDKEGNKRDSDGSETVLGARLDIGVLMAAELFYGYRSQKYNNDENLPDVDGVTYGASLTWNPTTLSTVRGTATRKAYESALDKTSGYLSSYFNLSADHELRRNILIGAGVGITTNEYYGTDREDEIIHSDIQAEWKLNRNLRTDIGFRFQRRDSNILQNEYDKDYFYLNLRYIL